jgi:hypothetical protein
MNNRRSSLRDHVQRPQRRSLRFEPLEDRRMLATFTVSNLNTAGSGSLRDAIELANSVEGADIIGFATQLSGGTISLTGGEIQITESLTIDATELAENITINANLQSRIFNITAETGDFAINGLTLIGGRTTASDADGGAIRSDTGGNLTLTQSNVSGSRTEGNGANGGGIFASGSVTLIQSTVSGNRTIGFNATGGGIYSNGIVTLTYSTVSDNSSDHTGGGGVLTRGNITLTYSTVSGNTGSAGGGIYAYGNVTLNQSTVSGNNTGGGSISRGGGIAATGTVTLTQSTVSGNTTSGNFSDGGGIFSQSNVILTQSTVTNNHATDSTAYGGGISSLSQILTRSSIIAGNTAGGDNPDFHQGSEFYFATYSLIGDTNGLTAEQLLDINSNPGNLLNVDPQLGPLADNGGPTLTHALLENSPAIDAGDYPFSSTPLYDQRGAHFFRVFHGDIDMGAFEAERPIIVDTLDESDGNLTAGNLSLREAIGREWQCQSPGTRHHPLQ